MRNIDRLRIVLVALVLMSAEMAEGQSSDRSNDHVASLVAKLDSGWNGKDTVSVSRLLAPRYQYFTSRGGLRSRAEMLRFLGSPEYVLEQATRSELAITMSGPAAVVSSRWQGRGTYRGKPFRDDQRCGQVWLQAGRTWELLSEHCVPILPDAP